MPRIKLANWYGDKAPGEELDVDDTRLKAMHRDGMVAEVIGQEQGTGLQPAPPAAVNAESEPEQAEPAPQAGRKRR
ncbi:hypothetical protein KEF29_03065 [Streptomyces tuirus]|uniref:Uncharacterized protein n=1 Tax=Streptomyces tuirus TaxID=68278 RepID=A0A941F8V1_9ACTN|nr:hypothetical protein [Streptomyces tuirus]